MTFIKSFIASALMVGALAAGHVSATPTNAAAATSTPTVQSQQSSVSTGVNINTANAATLAEKLNGIGMKKAEAIISYREKNGPFKSADDLINVQGIGKATLEKNRAVIVIN